MKTLAWCIGKEDVYLARLSDYHITDIIEKHSQPQFHTYLQVSHSFPWFGTRLVNEKIVGYGLENNCSPRMGLHNTQGEVQKTQSYD